MTLSEAQAYLAAALASLSKARAAQSASLGSRSVTRATLAELRAEVSQWQRVVQEIAAANSGARNPRIKVATWT